MTEDILVVGVCGAARSGKDTFASFLRAELTRSDTPCYSYTISMADPLRDMFRTLLAGLDPHCVLDWTGKDKDKDTSILLGRSPRYILQTLGTDWGREMVDKELWCEIIKQRIHSVREKSRRFAVANIAIIPDIRFDNESKLCDVIYEVTRTGTKRVREHSSEAGLSPHLIDKTILNNGTVEDLLDLATEEADELLLRVIKGIYAA